MQGIDDFGVERCIQIVIARPVLEQITEYIKCFDFRCQRADEVLECFAAMRVVDA